MAVETITKEELKQKLISGEPVQVVNVLDPKHYDLGFIKGSRKIPVAELDSRAGELDKAKEVVTYCAGPECDASRKGAEKLAAQGFKVRAYEGGIKEWKAAGFPVESEESCASTGESKSSCCG